MLSYLHFESWTRLLDFMMRGLEIGPHAGSLPTTPDLSSMIAPNHAFPNPFLHNVNCCFSHCIKQQQNKQ